MIMTVFPSTAGATWSTPPSGVITRCTTRSMRVSGATIRALPGDPGWLLAPVSPVASGAGPVAVAGELLCRVRAELPAVGQLGSGSSSWCRRGCPGPRSARSRHPHAGDVVAWLGWLAGRGPAL